MGKYKISSQYKPPAARCFTCKVQLNDRNRYLTHKRPQCKTCAKESATETRRRRARLDPTYKARELERLKKWQANNPEKVRHKNTQRKRSPIPKDRLPLEHWKTINTAFNCRCAYCDCWLEKESSDNPRSRVIEHVVPFSRGGRNDYTNIVPACRQCNSSKGTKNLRQWINDDQRYDFIVQTMGDIDYVLAPPPLPRPRTPATHMCTFGAEIRWPIRRIYAPPPTEGTHRRYTMTMLNVRDRVLDRVWDQVVDRVWDRVGGRVRDRLRGRVVDRVWDRAGNRVWDRVRGRVRNLIDRGGAQ